MIFSIFSQPEEGERGAADGFRKRDGLCLLDTLESETSFNGEKGESAVEIVTVYAVFYGKQGAI